MVAGGEDLGDGTTVPHSGTGILGILQQTVEMALVLKTLGICQDTGNHAADGVSHCHGSDLAAGEDEVTQGDLLIHALVDKTLVDALVMTADNDDIFHLAQADSIFLLEGMTAGGHIDGMHRAGSLIADGLPAAVQRIRGHHSAPAAAVGIIVGLVLLVGSVVPDLMGLNADDSPVLGPAQNALGEHIAQGLREQGHNINSHRCAYPR